MLGRQGCRNSLSCALGAPAPLRGAVFLSDEMWTSERNQEQNWPLSGGGELLLGSDLLPLKSKLNH